MSPTPCTEHAGAAGGAVVGVRGDVGVTHDGAACQRHRERRHAFTGRDAICAARRRQDGIERDEGKQHEAHNSDRRRALHRARAAVSRRRGSRTCTLPSTSKSAAGSETSTPISATLRSIKGDNTEVAQHLDIGERPARRSR